MSRSILLLSGGIDSLSVLCWKRPSLALTIDYGQRGAKAEIAASKWQCKSIQIEHRVLKIDCGVLGLGLMCKDAAPLPASRAQESLHSEWWPYRNQLLITFAAGVAIKCGLPKVLIGSVASDSRHRDGMPEFFKRISALLRVQEYGVSVDAPAIRLTTLELMRRAKVPISMIGSCHSCHTGNHSCGQCPGCRKQAFVLSEWLQCMRH